MNLKYLIVLVIAVVATAGFFIFKNLKNEEELKAHNKQQYNRIIEVAKKSSMAGMHQMARALNQYKEEKGFYPEKLSALYPDYIPVKAFIDEIQWYYEPGNNDFYLKKTYRNKNNKVLTASIGSDLLLQNESMVASIDTQKPSHAPTASKSVAKKPAASITLALETTPRTNLKTSGPDPNTIRRQTTGSEPGPLQASVPPQKTSKYNLNLISTAKLSEEEQSVMQAKGGFLVWKKEDGSLGFGNVQYPNSDEIIIYDKGEWLQIRHRSPNPETQTSIPQTRVEKEPAVDRLAAAYSDRFLVWKDSEGSVCFSNVQYPDNRNIRIHSEGSWLAAKK